MPRSHLLTQILPTKGNTDQGIHSHLEQAPRPFQTRSPHRRAWLPATTLCPSSWGLQTHSAGAFCLFPSRNYIMCPKNEITDSGGRKTRRSPQCKFCSPRPTRHSRCCGNALSGTRMAGRPRKETAPPEPPGRSPGLGAATSKPSGQRSSPGTHFH